MKALKFIGSFLLASTVSLASEPDLSPVLNRVSQSVLAIDELDLRKAHSLLTESGLKWGSEENSFAIWLSGPIFNSLIPVNWDKATQEDYFKAGMRSEALWKSAHDAGEFNLTLYNYRAALIKDPKYTLAWASLANFYYDTQDFRRARMFALSALCQGDPKSFKGVNGARLLRWVFKTVAGASQSLFDSKAASLFKSLAEERNSRLAAAVVLHAFALSELSFGNEEEVVKLASQSLAFNEAETNPLTKIQVDAELTALRGGASARQASFDSAPEDQFSRKWYVKRQRQFLKPAEQDLKRALSLAPKHADAKTWRGLLATVSQFLNYAESIAPKE